MLQDYALTGELNSRLLLLDLLLGLNQHLLTKHC